MQPLELNGISGVLISTQTAVFSRFGTDKKKEAHVEVLTWDMSQEDWNEFEWYY